jgi:hypothetical protein
MKKITTGKNTNMKLSCHINYIQLQIVYHFILVISVHKFIKKNKLFQSYKKKYAVYIMYIYNNIYKVIL